MAYYVFSGEVFDEEEIGGIVDRLRSACTCDETGGSDRCDVCCGADLLERSLAESVRLRDDNHRLSSLVERAALTYPAPSSSR